MGYWDGNRVPNYTWAEGPNEAGLRFYDLSQKR